MNLQPALVVTLALFLCGEVQVPPATRPTPEALVRITGGHLAFGPVALEMNVNQVETALKTRLRLAPTDNDIGCDGAEASTEIQGYSVTLTFTSASKMRLESLIVRIPGSRSVAPFVAAFSRQALGLHLEAQTESDAAPGSPKSYWQMTKDPPQHVLVSLAEHLMWIGRGCID